MISRSKQKDLFFLLQMKPVYPGPLSLYNRFFLDGSASFRLVFPGKIYKKRQVHDSGARIYVCPLLAGTDVH